MMGVPKPVEKYECNGLPALPRPDLKPPAGWSLKVISALETVRNHALSPDGKWAAFYWDRGDTSDLYVMATEGGWARRLTTGRGPVIPWDDELPAWSPDSQHLAFTMEGQVQVFNFKDGLSKDVTDFLAEASSPAWMPDSHGMVVSASRHEAVQILLTDREGNWLRALTSGSQADSLDARPSPDGSWVAYVSRRFDDLNRFDLCVSNLHTNQRKILSGKPGLANLAPRWRPDSRQLAFLSQETGFNEIWLAKLDDNQPRQLTRLGCDLSDISWSPGGDRLACVANRKGSLELALVDAASGEAETLLIGGQYARPNWSPGGEFLTYEFQSPHAPPDIYRVEVQTRQVRQLTFSNLPVLESLKMITPQAVSFRSVDGLEVSAYLYQPVKPNRAGVLYLHGGPSDQYVPLWDVFLQYLAACGYTILCPNYRGSTGYGKAFERLNENDWGGGDAQDCLGAADFLAGVPGVDAGRLGVMGPSYGGYLTNCLLSRDPKRRFRCGVSAFGDANLLTSWAQCSLRLQRYTESMMGNPAENERAYRKGSPVFQAEDVHAPLLLLHGLDDDIVPPQASEEWAQALRKAEKTFEYKTYANEPHGFLRRANQLDAWERIERFFNWYLMPQRTGDGRPETEGG
jgi:dipeptidyl aminopeptidase/acylaminoacyl peptidase